MSFLQSSEWEEFQKNLGRKTWREGGTLIIRHDLPGGFNYLYSPRPESVISNKLLVINQIAQKEKSIFLKIDPGEGLNIETFKYLNIKRSDALQPQRTTILDLQKSNNDILAAMHEKTRYNIRLAERKGVSVSRKNDAGKFWEVLRQTAERDSFNTHPRDHYEKLLHVNSPNFINEIFLAEYGGSVVAAAIVNFFDKTATYLHGGSSREHKEVMAPHLLHWRVIEEAKRRGMSYYDLWGIDDKKWPGVTRFKLGFGGEVVEYPRSIDILHRPGWYLLYNLARKL